MPMGVLGWLTLAAAAAGLVALFDLALQLFLRCTLGLPEA